MSEINVVHKANTDYNSRVVFALKAAHAAKTTRDLIDIYSNVKTLQDVTERIEWEMPEELKNNKNAETKKPQNTKEELKGTNETLDIVKEESLEYEEEER